MGRELGPVEPRKPDETRANGRRAPGSTDKVLATLRESGTRSCIQFALAVPRSQDTNACTQIGGVCREHQTETQSKVLLFFISWVVSGRKLRNGSSTAQATPVVGPSRPNSIKTRCRCRARVKNAGTRLETCGGTDGRVEIRGGREGESVNVLLARRCNLPRFLWISRLLTLEVDIARQPPSSWPSPLFLSSINLLSNRDITCL